MTRPDTPARAKAEKPSPQRAEDPMPHSERGAIGGRMRTPAKAKASAENLAKGRASRFTKSEIAAMSVTEMELRASTAKYRVTAARWLRRIAARGITLTPRQAEIVAAEDAKIARPWSAWKGSARQIESARANVAKATAARKIVKKKT